MSRCTHSSTAPIRIPVASAIPTARVPAGRYGIACTGRLPDHSEKFPDDPAGEIEHAPSRSTDLALDGCAHHEEPYEIQREREPLIVHEQGREEMPEGVRLPRLGMALQKTEHPGVPDRHYRHRRGEHGDGECDHRHANDISTQAMLHSYLYPGVTECPGPLRRGGRDVASRRGEACKKTGFLDERRRWTNH
jgi:hypothetical protein